jgi:cobalamin biosynthesis Co2+ chelatase CbiK
MNKENIFTKLQKLQNEIGSVSKDATNPFYKSKYFDINSLIKQLQPLLEKNNLVLLQPLESDYETNTEYVVTKIICPDSGKSLESRKKLSTQSDPQKLGSEITYYRRYTLQSLLALQAEDDDGNNAITADDEKSWLNQNTPQFTEAINFIKGGGSIDKIRTKYKVSKKVQDELTRL